MEEDIIEEGKFRYVERGDGPVILMLHGLFGALSNFRDVFDHFSENYRVVIPMLPIYELPVLETNIKNIASYVDDFLTFKGYDKVNLLGNSLGGHIALIYASRYSEHVNSIILTGSSGLYESAMGDTYPKRGNYEYIEEKVKVTFYDPEMASKELVDECYDIVNDKSKALRILALAKSAIRHNVGKDLPDLKMPVCLIWGKNDTITPPQVAEEFQKLLPDAELFWIDKCGHAAMMEHPTEFNEILQAWLKSRGI
jgi:pimeloyl-ACP methyl ester carboxylesterase